MRLMCYGIADMINMKKFNKGKELADLEDYVKEHFRYNPHTGVITRNDRRNSDGSLDKDGYLILKIKTKQFKAHRIAWFLYHGKMPAMEIDHINRDRSDNRICNLRISDRELNINNIKHLPNPTTGVVGVYVDRFTDGLKKIYTTRLNRKTYRFYSLDEAIKFRKEHGKAIK